MNQPNFPAGWDAARVERLIADHDQLTEDDLAAEDDIAAGPKPGQTVVTVPEAMLPAIRQLLATHKSA